MFSSRLPARLQPNAVSRAVGRTRAAGALRFDLTETNPTVVGLDYPAALVGAFDDRESLVYEPSALGSPAARAAVSARLDPPGAVPPGRIMLTASTSEAYSFLFKLLCDPGDDVLVPRPSYPLFDLLTALDGVKRSPYRLDIESGWGLDRSSVERARTPRTRALLVVSPNNPTGSMLRADDREWIVAFARAHALAVVSDEVFADYRLTHRHARTSFRDEDRVLTFTLGGLSKSAGLPQMKLAWTMVNGPEAVAGEALARLEVLADSYLSVSTPVQVAAGRLLEAGAAVRAAIRQRVARNLDALRGAAATAPAMTLHEPEGGWSAVVRVPAILSEEQWVLRLLEEHAVLVHPGFYFDLETEAYLVVSLLPAPEVFDQGIARLAALVGRMVA